MDDRTDVTMAATDRTSFILICVPVTTDQAMTRAAEQQEGVSGTVEAAAAAAGAAADKDSTAL